ncbi:hypothetical protein SEA_APIARY_34 [Rhodococcus phage Apiary]|nr:hypothetical protein SEA_BRAXOADDIE_34 [Rhodococcus phage Braxoaddie]WNM64957.1 hypothetical protein SEA_MASELOP_34 [Rhodococcus phage Maselop]WNM67418.1 hypothetical protein SEA_POLYYUKI_34 [Rhodococcus phage Polyyuki]WNM69842.1 hypothetical protein SEA_APIARY_34 [Rhodococcus phage Apiary]
MAQAKLKCHTWLRSPKGEITSFGPEDALPDWALELVSGQDHLFGGAASAPIVRIPAPSEEVPAPELNPEGPATMLEPAATELGRSENLPPESDDEDDDDEAKPPSRGASELEWRAFAGVAGVPVTDEMGRNDIIKACEEAEVIEAK